MIYRVEKRERFTVVDNAVILDGRLSFKALGVIVYLLSKPDNWEANAAEIRSSHDDGDFAVRGALKELEQFGYLERRRERDDGGKFKHITVVHERPHHTAVSASPCAETAGGETADRETAAEERPIEEQLEEPIGDDSLTLAIATPAAEIALCSQLADKIAAHRDGDGRPKITARWLNDMRLLIERGPLHDDDPKPVDPAHVAASIEYLFEHLGERGRDGFCWADQIRSPFKLRDKWHQLRDSARRQQAGRVSKGHAAVDRAAKRVAERHGMMNGASAVSTNDAAMLFSGHLTEPQKELTDGHS